MGWGWGCQLIIQYFVLSVNNSHLVAPCTHVRFQMEAIHCIFFQNSIFVLAFVDTESVEPEV